MTGPRPRSPLASADEPERRAATQHRVAPARRRRRRGTTIGRSASAGASSSARIDSIDTSGWSPRTMSAASIGAVERLDPDPDRARQAAAGIRVPDAPLARASRSRPRSVAASSPRTTTTSLEAGRRQRVEDVLQDRPAASGARSLPPPNRDPCARRGEDRTGSRRARSSSRSRRLAGASRPDHRAARAAVALGDDLGQDREGGLGRGAAAEVEPDRPAQPGELLLADARLEQPLAPVGLGLARADGADVAAAAPERLDDGRLVELHVVGQHGDRVVGPEADLVGDLVRPADDQPIDVGEALRRRERRPAIDDDGLEAELRWRAGRASARPPRRRRRPAAAGPGRPR